MCIYTLPAGTLTFPRVCGQTPGILAKWEKPRVSRENPGYSLNLPAEVKLIEFLCMLNNPGGYPNFFSFHFVPLIWFVDTCLNFIGTSSGVR